MASIHTIQECRDTLDELKEVCSVSHEKHRDLFMQMSNSFDWIFAKIESADYWKASQDDILALKADLQKLIEKVKYANTLMPPGSKYD